MAKKQQFKIGTYKLEVLRSSTFRLYGRLLTYAKPYWPGFVLATLSLVFVAATETALPALLKPVLDKGFTTEPGFPIWWVPTGLLGLFLCRGCGNFLSSYCMSWIANNVLRDLRQLMFSRLLIMPTSSFDNHSSGRLISRIIAEVNGVTSAATNVVTTIVRDSMVLLGLLGWLFWLNWKLTLVVFALLPFLGGLTLAFSSRMRKVSRGALTATAEMTRSVEEAISGNRVIKIFQGERQDFLRFSKVNSEFRNQSMKMTVAHALQTPLSQLIAAIGLAVVLTIALIQSRAGQSSVGDFVSFVTAMLMMLSPLRHLTDINSQLQRGLAAAESVFNLIDEKSENDAGRTILERVRGKIEFRDVEFRYPTSERAALSKISISIRAGETVGFVGPSGCGKTSLVNLIPRLYEINSGTITIDGYRIQDLTLTSLRSHIALVSQDIILFNDTIRNNITYGLTQPSSADFDSAILAADLKEFIDSLPGGIQTMIGDRGVRLSGGQRQRVAIARAILKNASILILDEATSALDSKTEEQVKISVDRLRRGRTTLIVAHRLSTVVDADRIFVLEGGSISDCGSHAELLKRNRLYLELYSRSTPEQQAS